MCKSKSDSANNGAILKHLAQQEYQKEYRNDPVYKLQREAWLNKNTDYYKNWHVMNPDYHKKYYQTRIARDPGYFKRYREKNRKQLNKYWQKYRQNERLRKKICS